MLKNEESKNLSITGATYLLFSALLVTLLFEKEIAAVSLFFLSIGDSVAGIAGAKFGRHYITQKKTLEGSLAMFVSCLFIMFFVHNLSFAVKILLSLIGTLVEAVDLPVDDNLLIPISVATTMWFFKQL